MKLALALTFGMALQAAATAAPAVDTSTSSLVTSSVISMAAFQGKGFPKPPRPPPAKTGLPRPPKPKSGFDSARKKLADKTVGKGRPKEKLDELNRRRNDGQDPNEKDDRSTRPASTSQAPGKESEAKGADSGTDLSPENHVRALRLELHGMKDELTLKAKKDGVKLRRLADAPESDLARFVAFKVEYYQGVCRWLETCDLSLRQGKGVAGGLRSAKPSEAAAKKDSTEGEEEEDPKSFAVMRKRFLEFQEKSHRKAAGKEDRPLLQRFHERLADHAAAAMADKAPRSR